MPVTYATAVAAVVMLLQHGARQNLRSDYQQTQQAACERLIVEDV